MQFTVTNNNRFNEFFALEAIDWMIGSIALHFKTGIILIIQITIRTLVKFVLLSGLIMSSFQDFILFVYDFVTKISSLRDL
ncbi:hypothetical protein [Ignavibacterium album]|uniref:hypothetical protein n=1 Tax=Ignavibacterium album TaxID=591197 RepID=UPI0038B3EB5F